MIASTLTSISNFYIVLMVTQMQLQRIDLDPLSAFAFASFINTMQNLTQKQALSLTLTLSVTCLTVLEFVLKPGTETFFMKIEVTFTKINLKKSYLVSICALACSHCARAWLTANCAFLSSALAMLGNFCSKNSLGNQTMWPTNVMPGIWK